MEGRNDRRVWDRAVASLVDGLSIEFPIGRVYAYGEDIEFRNFIGGELCRVKRVAVRYGTEKSDSDDYFLDTDALYDQYEKGFARRRSQFNFRVAV